MIKKAVEKTKKVVGELIFGVNPLIELLKAKKRKLISIYTTKPQPKGWIEVEKLLPPYNVAVQYVDRTVLSKMVESQDHQGFVAWVQSFAYQKKFFEPAKAPFIVLLDGVQDPRNLGAIIRSMYCMGVSGIVLIKKGASPLTPAAIKASAGLAEYMQIFVACSIGEALLLVKNAGYALYIATFGGKNVTEMPFQAPLCLVVGSEGSGVSHVALKEGTKITVPQVSSDVSYNASVAASLIAFVITQKMQKP